MSNNNFNSSNDYTVIGVTNISSNTSIIKRPYANTSYSSNKKQGKSNSFKDELNSLVSYKDSSDDSKDFSDLLMDELNDAVKLKNSENSRILKENFKNTSLNSATENDTILNTNIVKPDKKTLDNSELCKKIELLNSLRKEINN